MPTKIATQSHNRNPTSQLQAHKTHPIAVDSTDSIGSSSVGSRSPIVVDSGPADPSLGFPSPAVAAFDSVDPILLAADTAEV